MEPGDISDEETPLSNPKMKDLMRNAQSKVISMLVAVKTKDGMRQGAVMSLIKRFGMTHSTIYQLWE